MGEFWNLRRQHNREEKINKCNPQNTRLTATSSREAAQMFVSVTSKWGLNREVGTEQGGAGCMLRVRTGPEVPEDNLRELT